MPYGTVFELKFHKVIKFHDEIVAYATVNEAEACLKGRGELGVNTNPPSHVHGIIKFQGAVVACAAENGSAACPKERGDWGVNADPPSAAATRSNLPCVTATTGEWTAVACTGIYDMPILYTAGENIDAKSADVCLN